MQDREKASQSELMRRGVAALQLGRLGDAEECFRQAAETFADVRAYSNLAMALAAQGRAAEAVEAARRACALRPDVAELHDNLGNALQLAGDLGAAIEAYQQALGLRPDAQGVRLNLACALNAQGEFVAAIKHLETVLALHPGNLAGLINRGIALQGIGNLDGAVEAFERAISLHDSPDAHGNLALVLKDTGRVAEAIRHVQRSLEIRPDPKVADLLLLLIQYHPDYDRRRILEEHQHWYTRFVRGRGRPRVHERIDPPPGRKLRIGYVSPDFRQHPVGYNILPLIENHDRRRFEIFCYSNVTRPDALTDRFRAACDHWRNIRPLSDDQAAELIATDKIDVLLDLSLHTGENRLGVFARKPAPVQVTFAGYPGTTGLAEVDYRLTDPFLDPPAQGDGGFCERAVRLKDSFWCYQPLGTEPEVNELPALGNGFLTFGCLNNFCKVNDKVLDVWAEVLSRVENSRLILLTHPGSHRDRTAHYFQKFGVDASRIGFVAPAGRDTYLRTYHRFDVALDTFPYNGHTTSLDALWMGVPVVTLVGDMPVGRGGWSQLNNVGLAHLAAPDTNSYVRIAEELARDLVALARLRAELRGRMAASALCDGRGFSGSVESALCGVYRNLYGPSTSEYVKEGPGPPEVA